MNRRVTLQGEVSLRDKANSDYYLLPFEVPEDTNRIEIFFSYDRDENNVIDIGLFDSHMNNSQKKPVFRGWSGSARDHIVVTTHSATPGYLPGPLPAGTWHTLLGLYKLTVASCAYEIEIVMSDKEGVLLPQPPFPKDKGKLPPPKPGWFKGDLHSHTIHSDAHCTVSELAAAAYDRGLDFLAVTDHNTVSHHSWVAAASNDPLLIPGEEITTYYGHANVWGIDRWMDFRFRTPPEIALASNEVHRLGGIFSVNHPKPNGPDWGFGSDVPFDCMEVWQSLWHIHNDHSMALWERLLNKGRYVTAVGGSDSHPFHMKDARLFHLLGFPTTWIYADTLSTSAILDSIRAGHVSISACPSGVQIILEAESREGKFLQGDVMKVQRATINVRVVNGQGLLLRLITAHGSMLQASIPTSDWTLENDIDLAVHRYVRAEVRVPTGGTSVPPNKIPMAALTNPIWHADALKKHREGIET